MIKNEEDEEKRQIRLLKQQINSIREQIKDVNETLNHVIKTKIKETSMEDDEDYPIDLVQYCTLLNAKVKVNSKILLTQNTQLLYLQKRNEQCEQHDYFAQFEDQIHETKKSITILKKQKHHQGVDIEKHDNFIGNLQQNLFQYSKVRHLYLKFYKRYTENEECLVKLQQKQKQLQSKQKQQKQKLLKYQKYTKLFQSQNLKKKRQVLKEKVFEMKNKKNSMQSIVEKRIVKVMRQIDDVKKNIQFQDQVIKKYTESCEMEQKITKQIIESFQKSDKRLKYFVDKYSKLPQIKKEKDPVYIPELQQEKPKKYEKKLHTKIEKAKKSRYSTIEDPVNLSTGLMTKFRISRRNNSKFSSASKKEDQTNYKTLALQKQLNQ